MKVLIPLAEGAEDMETAILADVFRRANWQATLAGMAAGPVRCARGLRLLADAEWGRIDPASFDAIVIPGGSGGVETLRRHAGLREALRRAHAGGKIVGAVCAGPLVLHDAGLLDGRTATCYPGLSEGLTGTDWREDRVVADGNLVTSRGPGTCLEFALEIVARAEGRESAAAIARDLLADAAPAGKEDDA